MMRSGTHVHPQGGTVLGFPLRGFGLFTSLLLSFAVSLFTFCATTCVAIFALIAWNVGGHHNVDFADSYRNVGLPASLIALAIALPVFGTLWVRSKLKR